MEVNANGLTVAAWEQYSYSVTGGSTIGVAIQSGGQWSAPFTISGATGFSMAPQVAVGADGTMAVSWTYQDPQNDPVNYPNPQQKIQVAVKSANVSTWTTKTLAVGSIGGVAIIQNSPVAIDASGNITVAWSYWNGTKHDIQVSTRSIQSATWSTPLTVSRYGDNFSVDGMYPALATTSTGNAAIAFAISPYTSTIGSCDRVTPKEGTCILYVQPTTSTTSNQGWSWPVAVSETMSTSVGYISAPQIALDSTGAATVIYQGNGVEATTFTPIGWTVPSQIIQPNIFGASYSTPDLAVDANGNAVAAVSIFDPTINVDRSSVWVAKTTSPGSWGPATRITDPSVPVDAYGAKVALSANGAVALVGWLDHYHGIAQVSKWTGNSWGSAVNLGKPTASASFQEIMSLDAASATTGTNAVARAIWKASTKTGTQINAASFSQ
ncbi:MAG: hypothetical protein ACXV7J_06995 [Methylomonas sp.]